MLERAVRRWDLSLDGPAMAGHASVVLPVRRDGERLALKAGWPHALAHVEHVALRLWAGGPAARLAAADPSSTTMLIERLDPGRTLAAEPLDEACETLGRLLGSLAVPAPPVVPEARGWLAAELARPAAAELPRRLTSRATGLLDDLGNSPPRLVHGDLHFDNVLARPLPDGRREWVAIDPQPLAGHPGLDLQAVLRDRTEEYPPGSGLRWGVRNRLGIVCEAAGLDEDEARLWCYLRTCVDAIWAVEDGDHDQVRLHISLMKALDG